MPKMARVTRVIARDTSREVAAAALDALTKQPSGRIFWDSAEREKIAAHVAEARRLSPTASIVTLAEKAMEAVIEPERHREGLSIASMPWLGPAVKDYLAFNYPSKSLMKEEFTALENANSVLAARVAELEAELLLPPDLSKLSTAELHAAYIGRIKQEAMAAAVVSKDAVVAEVLAELSKRPTIAATSHGHNSPVTVNVTMPTAPRRLKIVVVGGKSEALRTIATGVKASGIDATFVHKHMDDPSLGQGRTLPSADYYLVIGGTVGKQIRDRVLQAGGTAKTIFSKSTGAEQGLSELMKRLRPAAN